MQDALRDLMERRCNATCGKILTMKEELADPVMSVADSTRFRKLILDQVNEFHQLCRDIVDSVSDENSMINQLYLDKLEKIHEYILDIDYDDE